MKTLVVFYSLEGNTKFIADVIAKHLQADTLELKTAKPFPSKGFKKFFKGGMSVVFKQKPKLDNKDIDLNPYDNIIIGTPVWAGTFAPPLRTFLRANSLAGKHVALFACCSGGNARGAHERPFHRHPELPHARPASGVSGRPAAQPADHRKLRDVGRG